MRIFSGSLLWAFAALNKSSKSFLRGLPSFSRWDVSKSCKTLYGRLSFAKCSWITPVDSLCARSVSLSGFFSLALTCPRVETHIIWDAPALVTASYSGATCDICVYWETATFNSNVTWDWWRQESVAMSSENWVRDHWDHDETGCEVETADVAVTSSYPCGLTWHSL